MRMQAIKPMLRYLTALILLMPIAAPLDARNTDLGRARIVVETKSVFQADDTMAFGFVGRVANRSPNPQHVIYDGDLTSLATGEKAGSLTWDHGFAGRGVSGLSGADEVTTTFRLAGGTLVSRAQPSGVPDPNHPGFFLIGIHPEGNSIIEATGVFAGRTGRAHMSGFHGAQEAPAFVSFDDFWLIELDPKA
jgi:hypothetical protein